MECKVDWTLVIIQVDLDLNAKVGFKLGGGFEYAFNDTWSLQPSLFLTSKGAKKDGNSINAMYLELPVMAAARFNVADNTNLVVNAGPYLLVVLPVKQSLT